MNKLRILHAASGKDFPQMSLKNAFISIKKGTLKIPIDLYLKH